MKPLWACSHASGALREFSAPLSGLRQGVSGGRRVNRCGFGLALGLESPAAGKAKRANMARGKPFTSESAASFGRLGGARTSRAKAHAARRNGGKGGRPKKTPGAIEEALKALRADLASVLFACPRCKDPKTRPLSIDGSRVLLCGACGAIFEADRLGMVPRWLTPREVDERFPREDRGQLLDALVKIVSSRPSQVRAVRARKQKTRRARRTE